MKSIDSLAAQSARQAQADMAMLQRDVRALRDRWHGAAIHAPMIRAQRHMSKRITTNTIFGVAIDPAVESLASTGLSLLGGSASAAQKAGQDIATIALGQRIR